MAKELRIRFAKKLQAIRKKKGFTQEKLSECSEIDYRYIQEMESLKNPPSVGLDTIEKLAKALKVKPSTLL